MQSNIVSVQPNVLLETSRQMLDHVNSIKALYQDLMKLIEDSAGWKGDDATTFSIQFKGFEDDFENLDKLLYAYAQVIKQCSEGYVKTQEALYAQGRCL